MGTTRTFLVQRVEVSGVERYSSLGLVSDGGWFSFRLEDCHYRSFFSQYPLLNGQPTMPRAAGAWRKRAARLKRRGRRPE